MLSWFSWIVTAGKWLFQLLSGRKSPIVQVAEDDGAANAGLNAAKVAVNTETAIANAEANTTNTTAGVVSRLNGGTF